MKHLFVINPAAGRKKGRFTKTEREILRFTEELADPFEAYVTKRPMDAARKVALDADSCDKLFVYACGGDGTLNECVNGAAGRSNVAVTHFPCGTGNDFIKMFGKADEQKFGDLRALADGVVRPIDVIDCNGRYCINISSVGIDARIGTDVHKYSSIPVIGGATGYVTSLVVNLLKGVTQKFSIHTESEAFEGKYTLVCACNGRFYGGGFNPVPDASPIDGMIDFLIVKGVSRIKFISVVGRYAKGRFRELDDIITHMRGSQMRIEGEREFVVNVDGEAIHTDNLLMKVVPKGVNFIFPQNMEFFG